MGKKKRRIYNIVKYNRLRRLQNNIQNNVQEEWISCQANANKLVQRKRPTKDTLFGPDESWPEEPPQEPASNTSTTDVPIEDDNVENETEDIQRLSPEEKLIIGGTEDDIEEVTEHGESGEVQKAEEWEDIKVVVLDDKEAAPLVEWPIKKHLCRCCLVEGTFDSLHAPAPAGDVTYDEMLLQCFGIELFPVSSDVTTQLRGVCGLCAARLRDAHAFRHQVCMSDARFRDLYTRGCITVAGATEVTIDLRGEFPCFDDHFGYDMDETENSEELPVEFETKSTKQSTSEIVTAPKNVQRAPILRLTELPKLVPIKRKSTKGKTQGGKMVTAPKNVQRAPIPRLTELPKLVPIKRKSTKGKTQGKIVTAPKNTQRAPIPRPTELPKPGTDQSNTFIWKDNKYKCKKCEMTYTELRLFRRHYTSRHSNVVPTYIRGYAETYEYERIEDLYKCKKCEKTFKSASSFCMHFRNNHLSRPKKNFKCSHCENSFPTRTRLMVHKLKDHNIDERFKCGACDKGFNKRTQLHLHLNVFHMMGEKIKCSECDFECYKQYNLNKHMVKHKTTKDFHCKYCKKSFLRRTTLNFHERIHTGDKQKQCTECGQAFVQKASLNYHMAKHHPNVKF